MRQAAWIYRKYPRLVLPLLGLIILAACAPVPPTIDVVLPTAMVEVVPTPTQAQSLVTQEPSPTQSEPGPTASEPAAAPALSCTSPAELTPSMTEGPFYTPGSPERTSLLEPDTPGTPLTISGYVLTPDCTPIAGAWLDFWQTDGEGVYDNAGFKLRGHQFTGADGSYRLETVLPGEYPGRTAHIHVKVQAPNGPVLTSQLFFPGAAGNASDSIFSEQLLVEMSEGTGGLQGIFNFILEAP